MVTARKGLTSGETGGGAGGFASPAGNGDGAGCGRSGEGDPRSGRRDPGLQALGVKEDGVGYALDDNNKSLITDEMKAAVEKAKADIISGAVKVHDYMSDNSCPK